MCELILWKSIWQQKQSSMQQFNTRTRDLGVQTLRFNTLILLKVEGAQFPKLKVDQPGVTLIIINVSIQGALNRATILNAKTKNPEYLNTHSSRETKKMSEAQDYFQYARDFTLELPSLGYSRGPSSRLLHEKAVRVFPGLLVPWQFDDGSIEPDFILSIDNRVRMQYLHAAKQIFQRYFAETARNNPNDIILTSLEPLSWPTPGRIKGLTMLYLEISVLISL